MKFDIVNPVNIKELLTEIKKHQKSNYRLVAGCTDVLLEIKRKPTPNLVLVNLSSVKDVAFRQIKKIKSEWWIGAGVTANSIIERLDIKEKYPTLHEAAFNLASNQIRQVATIGGNICTASPSGDIACAIVALGADFELMNTSGKTRRVNARNFFTGPRQTVMKPNEFLYGIAIPLNNSKTKEIFSGFIKIGTRKSMECSVVSLGYHIQVDAQKKIIECGLAIGAVAPTIKFVQKPCEKLTSLKLNELNSKFADEFSKEVLKYASPISDVRATDWYRKEVLQNISRGVIESLQQ